MREQGYSKEEATKKSASKIPLAILSTKADDYIGKNSKIIITNNILKILD